MYASWSLAEMALFTKSYRYDFATCNHTVTLKPAFGSCSCPCLYTPHSRLPHGLRGSAWLHCLTMRLCHRRSVQDRISVTPCPVSHVFLGPSTTDHHVLHLSLCLHCMRICLPEIWGTSQWSLRCAQKGTGPGQWQFKHKPSPS